MNTARQRTRPQAPHTPSTKSPDRRPAPLDPSVTDEKLRAIKLFAGLTAAELEMVLEQISVRWAEIGETLFTAGHASNSLFVSLSAHVRVLIVSPFGRQVVARSVRPGGFCGECAILNGLQHRDTTAQVTGHGYVLELPAAVFLELTRANLAVCQAILHANACTLALMTDRNYELAALDLRDRLQIELLRLSRDGKEVEGKIVIDPAPTHESFAALVGGTREGVTREMRIMVRQGLIAQRRKQVTLLDAAQLRQLVLTRAGPRPSHAPDFED